MKINTQFKKLLIINFGMTIIALFMVACSSHMSEAYETLKKSELSGEELFQKVFSYEAMHAEHFESKLDLAQLYFLSGQYEKSLEYLMRAESVVGNAPRNKDGKRMIAQMYGTRAELEMLLHNYESAITYAKKSKSADKIAGLQYKYIEAHALYVQEKYDEALTLFDTLFSVIPESASNRDMRTYMLLLAKRNRANDCKKIVERYFSTGAYFLGFGQFASSLYEKCGDMQRAVLAAFLDYEYASCFGAADEYMFLKRLDEIEKEFVVDDAYKTYESAVKFVRSFFASQELEYELECDFFVKRYISAVKKSKAAVCTEADIKALLAVENYFSYFPSYYWHTYNAFLQVRPDAYKDFVPVLEKIIVLGNDNVFIADARKELGKIQGLSAAQSQHLLIPSEVNLALAQYARTRNDNALESIFELLALPDNEYELYALTLLRKQRNLLNLDDALFRRRANASSKLVERIDFILG